MADGIFNVARGRLVELVDAGEEDLIIILLKDAETEADLVDHNTLDALLNAVGNTEADFSDYARKTVANASVDVTVDDTNNRTDVDIPDQTWTGAGNGTNNSLEKLIVCIDGATDAARIPVSHHDFVATTDGNDLTAQIAAAGFYRSS